MSKDVPVYLADILESCERIARYTEGVSESEFTDSEETQDAVIRRFEIIGEAVKRLPREYRNAHADVAWDEAAGIRDMHDPCVRRDQTEHSVADHSRGPTSVSCTSNEAA